MDNKNFSYKRAAKRIKRIKGFYIHLTAYLIVNSYIFFANLLHTGLSVALYSMIGTGIFWGIGIFFHWFSVFGKNFFFSKEWEERKIKKLMKE